MALLRRVTAAELETFTDLPDREDRNKAVRVYLAELLAGGLTRPEWCFTGTTDTVTSAVLWCLPGADVPFAVVLLELDWTVAETSANVAAIRELLAHARSYGVSELHHAIDIPEIEPQFQRYTELRDHQLTAGGFALAREGMRWRWTAEHVQSFDDVPPLTFRPLTEVGRTAFVETLAATLRATDDSWLTADIAEHGLMGAAERYLNDMSQLEHEDDWFELGYDTGGTAVAVSMPARNPSYPVIGYVGVTPAARGNGYARTVLARSTEILHRAGATEIRGDCDSGNVAMVKAFNAAGYKNFCDRHDLVAVLK